MCSSGLAIDWAPLSAFSARRCQRFLQFDLLFGFCLSLCCCLRGHEGVEAGGLYVCSAGGKAQTSRASKQQQTVTKSSELTFFSSSNSPRSPTLTFPSPLHRLTNPPASLFRRKIFHFWAARRSSLPSLDRLRPGTELIHTHRRKGSGAGTPPIIGGVVTAHAQL